jgi:DNA polymerase-3 subunit delta'
VSAGKLMSFNDIYGQEKQIAILKNTMKRKHVPHAYLFHGIKGIGKRTTAKVFAKALNCLETNLDSCDRCSSCLKVDHGNHPDVTIIEPKGIFIKINTIRDLQNQMKFRPLEGKKRIIIIIDADRMNSIAANALLKTLEEPSLSNILILITSRPYMLPATILSRCQHLRFNPIQKDKVTLLLEKKSSLDRESAYLLASTSGGSIGKALKMNKDSYLTLRNEIIEKISTCNFKDPLEFLSFVDSFGKDRKGVTKRLEILKSWYRDILVYRETGETESLIHQDRIEAIKNFADVISGSDILKNIKAINRAHSAIEQNANKDLTLEWMIFKLSNFAKSQDSMAK